MIESIGKLLLVPIVVHLVRKLSDPPTVRVYEMDEGYKDSLTFSFRASLDWEVVRIKVIASDGVKNRIAQDLYEHTKTGDRDNWDPMGLIWREYCDFPEGNQQPLQAFYVNHIHREAVISFVCRMTERSWLKPWTRLRRRTLFHYEDGVCLPSIREHPLYKEVRDL